MIQALQALAGINEPPKRALAEWRKMGHQGRLQTFAAYEMFCGVGKAATEAVRKELGARL